MLRSWKEVYACCGSRGFKPQLHKTDNETLKDVEDFIASQQTDQQYTPPDMHRPNPLKRSIQTYKSCIKSTVASLPPKFPIAYWCRLIPQVDFSVNILSKFRQNPLLLAWAAMEGEYHFYATPVAPPGSEMLMKEKPNRRKQIGLNAKKAWYIYPCFKHYRTFKGVLQSTGQTHARHCEVQAPCHHNPTTCACRQNSGSSQAVGWCNQTTTKDIPNGLFNRHWVTMRGAIMREEIKTAKKQCANQKGTT